MRMSPFVIVVLCLLATQSVARPIPLRVQATVRHPSGTTLSTPVKPVTDTYYGATIVDPYRYLENLADPDVDAWMKAETDYTRAVLGRLPGKVKLLKRIAELDHSTAGDIGRVRRLPGNVYLYTKLLPGEETYKLYIRTGLKGREKLLLDPEKVTIAEGNRGKGKNAIGTFEPSNDIRFVVVTITPGGSENDTEIHVIETASGRETGDVIHRCCIKSDPVWLTDDRSFVYGRLQDLHANTPSTEIRQKYRAYLHVLGTDATKDPAVFGYGVVPSIGVDPRLYSSIRTQPGSKYVLGVIGSPIAEPNSAFYIAPVNAIRKRNTAWHKIADFSDEVAEIAIHGDDLYLLTYKSSPRFKIIHVDARNPNLTLSDLVVPQGEGVIQEIAPAQDALYVRVLDGGIGRILRVPYIRRAKPEKVPLPYAGNASLFGIDPRVPGTLLLVNSWTRAYKIYAYDPSTKKSSDTKLQPAGPHDEFDNVEVEEVKVPSHDGMLVPLSIVYPRGVKLDGSNPTLLYAYGAYGISQSPTFDFTQLAWYERGGINATCHVRGGGEYGEEWHEAGKKQTKSNSWLDFIACAQYLIQKKFTSSPRLAAQGASMGCVTVARAMTERPGLFAAILVEAGISDFLRAEAADLLDEAEQGNTKTEEGFKILYAMSPYYHIKDGTPYPAALFSAGINDPRLKPWQSAKMVARLQAATASGKPVLLYIDYAGGHDVGTTATEYESQLANSWSFLLWQFGSPEFQPVR
jgi:prolyl oligopeptidase